jgi:hypothetical protein
MRDLLDLFETTLNCLMWVLAFTVLSALAAILTKLVRRR